MLYLYAQTASNQVISNNLLKYFKYSFNNLKNVDTWTWTDDFTKRASLDLYN